MNLHRVFHYSYLSTVLLGLFLLCFWQGCTPVSIPMDTGTTTSSQTNPGSSDEQGGGESAALQMPVIFGREFKCTQGAFGAYSHDSDSTRYDIDFDTPNNEDWEVFAPVSGTVHVHTDSATSGFGYHLNIDVGGGRYVVIAHLKDVFVADGSEVAAGQLLGYEGCTGDCTGDHIHIGLHEGDAGQDASQGDSIPTTYWAANASDRSEPQAIASEDFVCGIASEGDEQDGDFYESQLTVTLWHPDGTLVKTPDNARVYVLENGQARWIANEEIFWSWRYEFQEVVLISPPELACLGEGEDIDSWGYVNAFFDSQGQLWLLVGMSSDPDNYRIAVRERAWESVLASWGLVYSSSNMPGVYPDSHGYVTDWPVASGYAGFRQGSLVKEEDASDVWAIVGDQALPIASWDVYLKLGYGSRTIFTVEDGVVGELHSVGSCAADVWCVDEEAVSECGGGMEIDGSESGGYSTHSDEDDEDDDADDEVDGEEWNNEEDEDDDDKQEEDDASQNEETQSEEAPASVTDCLGQDACLVDADADGRFETLLMDAHLWLTSGVDEMPAYVYGNGGCFNGAFTTSDLVYSNREGFYEINFADFTYDCEVQMTLVASAGTDGSPPASDMNNWYWWQNEEFCSQGSDLCELMDNGTSWEEWLFALSWDPENGLQAIGNGYTSNSQL